MLQSRVLDPSRPISILPRPLLADAVSKHGQEKKERKPNLFAPVWESLPLPSPASQPLAQPGPTMIAKRLARQDSCKADPAASRGHSSLSISNLHRRRTSTASPPSRLDDLLQLRRPDRLRSSQPNIGTSAQNPQDHELPLHPPQPPPPPTHPIPTPAHHHRSPSPGPRHDTPSCGTLFTNQSASSDHPLPSRVPTGSLDIERRQKPYRIAKMRPTPGHGRRRRARLECLVVSRNCACSAGSPLMQTDGYLLLVVGSGFGRP